MSDEHGQLPTIRGWLEQWLGFQIPTLSLPQTLKNLDKAISTIVLATASNAKVRIDGSTGKVKAATKIAIDDMFENASERRRFENRAATTRAALEDLKDQPANADAPDEIEEDWLNTFGRLAEEKSSEELQALFGKILAGEVRKPGSYSLRTLQFVSNLSRLDAEAIASVFPYVLNRIIVPFVGVQFEDLAVHRRIMLQELGVLTGNANKLGGVGLTINVKPSERYFILGTGFGLMIENKSNSEISTQLAAQPITSVAGELLKLSKHKDTDDAYLKEVGQIIGSALGAQEREGKVISKIFALNLIKLDLMLSNGSFRFSGIENLVTFESSALE